MDGYRLIVRGALLLLVVAWVLTLLRFVPELIALLGLLGRATAGVAGALRLLTTPSRHRFSPANLVVVVGVILLASGGATRLLGLSAAVPEPDDHSSLPSPDLLVVLAMVLADLPSPRRD